MKKSVLRLSLVVPVLLLGACGSLQDVSHRWCPTPMPVAETATTSEQVTLSADALFKFDKAEIGDLLPEGQSVLDKLVGTLTSGYVRINQIELVGHTDRLGTEKYNQALGLARAEAVRKYLEARGVQTRMLVASKGSSEPITQDCQGSKATPALKACLQPDRRVTLMISGVKQVNQ